jgi:hypothetical protein
LSDDIYKGIIPAQDPQDVESLLKEQSQRLGKTADGKCIYLYQSANDTAVLLEIGRLRELTFRTVGEGSGKAYDLSKYDYYYDHLVLWDDEAKELVGSYRIIPCDRALAQESSDNPEPLYTQSLFNLSDAFKEKYFPQGVEMGRSFVQPKYWGSRSLDYLWYGIAAYFQLFPHLRYFIGAVSISKEYPDVAKSLLVHFYSHLFQGEKGLATAKTPFEVDTTAIEAFVDHFDLNAGYKENFKALKSDLTAVGVPVPTLYKQYTEMYEEDGVQFLTFTVNTAFDNAIDGLIIADTEKVKESKKQRYLKGLSA